MKTLIAKLMGLTAQVWDFFLPLLRELLVTGISALLPLALEIVRSLAQTDKTSGEKRNEAIRALKAAAVEQGISASESLIRFAVESAVQKMKVNE